MLVERTDSEIILRIPSYIGIEDVERFISLMKINEATAQSQATQEDIDNIARESKKGWWNANRERFIQS